MKTSIIIPTYNGAHKIPLLLDALLKQTFSDFEVIIVVDGSTDNTVEVLHQYENKFNSFRIIEQANEGRSKVRNRGVKEAQGELLIFYDDDMVPLPDSVKKHYEFHLQNNESILTGNPTENIEPHKTDIQNYKAWLTKKWTAKYTQHITHLHSDNLFFTAANCSIPRTVFEELNGFDDRLNDIEDYEFAYRALSKNIQLFFDKSNIAIHNDPITCKSYLKRMQQYSKAQKEIAVLIPNLFLPERKITLKKKLIYWPFSFSLWIKIIDSNFLPVLIPKKLRYSFYDKVLYAQGVIYIANKFKSWD